MGAVSMPTTVLLLKVQRGSHSVLATCDDDINQSLTPPGERPSPETRGYPTTARMRRGPLHCPLSIASKFGSNEILRVEYVDEQLCVLFQ